MAINHMSPDDHLHQVSAQYHWVYADSLLLQTIVNDQTLQRGKAGTRLNNLLRLFGRIKLAYVLLFLTGATELIKLLYRQAHAPDSNSDQAMSSLRLQTPPYYFVGFGAGPEEQLFASYCASKNFPIARIDQIKIESMALWHRVTVVQAISSLVRAFTILRRAIANLPEDFCPWRNDFMTYSGMRLGYYSYMYAWFKQLKLNTPHVAEVCFLAADTAAFAAVNAGLTTRYLQHGLNRHSMILPKFDYVDALTHDEMVYFGKRLPDATICLVRPILPLITPRQPPCLLVASVYGDHDELRRILPLLEFADHLGLTILVRPHPCEDRSFWNSSKFHFNLSLEDSDASFDAALDRLQPALVVSWFSTALVDALYRGIIPVSVSARDDPNIQDMIYPLFRHCLHWPDDQAIMEKVVFDQVTYASTLTHLGIGMK